MDDDLDLRHFANKSRLFPLPRVVLFPHAVLPLHIFEPRYRQMTEDALNGDKFVTIVQLHGGESDNIQTLGSPPLDRVGCLGRILQHERLPDGRFNFLLLGRKRVRLRHELDTDRLYRIAEVEILEDVPVVGPEEGRRVELTGLFRRTFERQGPLDGYLSDLLQNGLPLGVLTDIVAHALGLPASLKQQLLGETRVEARADRLLKILKEIEGRAGPDAPQHFPPPFSPN